MIAKGCYHCGDPLVADSSWEEEGKDGSVLSFCCAGCLTAYRVISGAGGVNYYRFREGFSPRPAETQEAVYEAWEKENPPDDKNRARGVFILEGMHCASCVWLNEKVLLDQPGVLSAQANRTLGRVTLEWDAGRIRLADLARALAPMGYRLTPADNRTEAEQTREGRELLKKVTTAGFFAGNIMLISIALYSGYFTGIEEHTRNFFHLVAFFMTLPVYFYSASPFFRGAYHSVKHGVISMDVLTSLGLSLAFFYSVRVAFSGQGEIYFDSICFIVFAVLAGRYLERRLRFRTMMFVDNLRQSAPRFARVRTGRKTSELPVAEIRPGMTLILEGGRTVPLDGELLDARAEVDESLLTGEFRPILKKKGEIIYSGSRPAGETARIRVISDYRSSALARIGEMAEQGLREIPPVLRITERISRWFIAFVLFAGGATFVYWLDKDPSAAFMNTVTLLIVACPCALNLAVPAVYTASLSRAFRSGVLLKNGAVLETLARAVSIGLDKTGTLTAGSLSINDTKVFSSALNKQTALAIAGALERSLRLKHPIVQAFLPHAPPRALSFQNARYVPGRGARGSRGKKEYLLGSRNFVSGVLEPAPPLPDEEAGMAVYLAERSLAGKNARARDKKGALLAVFYLNDPIRPEAASIIRRLKDHARLFLLTGDEERNARRVARETGLAEWYAGADPARKKEVIARKQEEGIAVMVGDGVNDAAALGRAHVGISFADAQELSLHSADVLLLGKNLNRLEYAFRLARRARGAVRLNLALAFAYNFLLIPLAFSGAIIPLLGAIFMSLSSLTVIGVALLVTRVDPLPE